MVRTSSLPVALSSAIRTFLFDFPSTLLVGAIPVIGAMLVEFSHLFKQQCGQSESSATIVLVGEVPYPARISNFRRRGRSLQYIKKGLAAGKSAVRLPVSMPCSSWNCPTTLLETRRRW